MTNIETEIRGGQLMARAVVDEQPGSWHLLARDVERVDAIQAAPRRALFELTLRDGSTSARRALISGTVITVLDDTLGHDRAFAEAAP